MEADNYEEKAVEFLKLKGYKILNRNFRTKFGEIDIIAKDKKYTVFVEVKGRSSNYKVSGLEAVDFYKKNKIKKASLFYSIKIPDGYFRFDVLEIIRYKDFYQYNLIKNAFTLDEL